MISATKARQLADERQDYLEEVEEQLGYVEDEIKKAADKGLYMVYVSLDNEPLLPEVIKEIKNNGFYLREEEEEKFGQTYIEYLIDWNKEETKW